jgi:hypothetical protein
LMTPKSFQLKSCLFMLQENFKNMLNLSLA